MGTSGRDDAADEGRLDPQVAAWLEANPTVGTRIEELPPEVLALARGADGAPPTRSIAHVGDDVVNGIGVRTYQRDDDPTGLVVYFHGGGFCIGGLGVMDNVARELAHATGAVVVSVEYRLAPENPYPAGLDDCEGVTRWAFEQAREFGVSPTKVVVAGESAGGNLAAAVALRLRPHRGITLAGQLLIYPSLDPDGSRYPSRAAYAGLVVARSTSEWFWDSYTAGRDLGNDPFVAPVRAPELTGLPPALVLLGGCDALRDEGRWFATRLRDAGVEVDAVCYPGQPHGFINFGLPAAGPAFEEVGRWVRGVFAPRVRGA